MSFRVMSGPHAPTIRGAFLNFMKLWADNDVSKRMSENNTKYKDSFHGFSIWAETNFNIQVDVIYKTNDVYSLINLEPSPSQEAFNYTNPLYDIDPYIGPNTRHRTNRINQVSRIIDKLDNEGVPIDTSPKGKLQRLLAQIKGGRYMKAFRSQEVKLYNKHCEELNKYYKENGWEAANTYLKKLGYNSATFKNSSRSAADDFVITLDENCLTPEHEAVLFVMKFG